MRPFKDFTSDFIAVSCKDKNERYEFLKLCEENGIKWAAGGELPTEYNPPDYAMVLFLHYDELKHNDEYRHIRHGYEIVPASKFLRLLIL